MKIFVGAGPQAVARISAMDKEIIRHKPKTPHMYLSTIGVVKAARGKGLGGRLIKPVLEVCDAAGLPAYLENSNPNNHGFYTSHGFEVMGPSISPENAPPLIPMWRSQ